MGQIYLICIDYVPVVEDVPVVKDVPVVEDDAEDGICVGGLVAAVAKR